MCCAVNTQFQHPRLPQWLAKYFLAHFAGYISCRTLLPFPPRQSWSAGSWAASCGDSTEVGQRSRVATHLRCRWGCALNCAIEEGVACEERIGRRRYVVDQCMLGTFCWDAIAFDLFSNWHLFSFAFFAMYLVVCLIVSSNVIVSKYELGFISDRNKSDLQNEFCPSFSCCDDVWGHERSLATLRISSSTSCSQRRW